MEQFNARYAAMLDRKYEMRRPFAQVGGAEKDSEPKQRLVIKDDTLKKIINTFVKTKFSANMISSNAGGLKNMLKGVKISRMPKFNIERHWVSFERQLHDLVRQRVLSDDAKQTIKVGLDELRSKEEKLVKLMQDLFMQDLERLSKKTEACQKGSGGGRPVLDFDSMDRHQAYLDQLNNWNDGVYDLCLMVDREISSQRKV